MSDPSGSTGFSDAVRVNLLTQWLHIADFQLRPLFEDDDSFKAANPLGHETTEATMVSGNPLSDAYANGYAGGEAASALQWAEDQAALKAMLTQLPQLTPQPARALAMVLAQAVSRLVEQVVGELAVDPAFLARRCAVVADMITSAMEPVRLHLHPDDMAIVSAARPGLELVPDAARARGSLLLETGDGWIADGPEIRLAALRDALDAMAEEQ